MLTLKTVLQKSNVAHFAGSVDLKNYGHPRLAKPRLGLSYDRCFAARPLVRHSHRLFGQGLRIANSTKHKEQSTFCGTNLRTLVSKFAASSTRTRHRQDRRKPGCLPI